MRTEEQWAAHLAAEQQKAKAAAAKRKAKDKMDEDQRDSIVGRELRIEARQQNGHLDIADLNLWLGSRLTKKEERRLFDLNP